MSKQWISVRNWTQFQHYKDRNPSWIKTYCELLSDETYLSLSTHQRAVLHGVWLAFARGRGKLTADTRRLSWMLSCRVRAADLRALDDFIEITDEPDEDLFDFSDWPSRYVDEATRDAVRSRDGHACVQCGACSQLEIDHVIPVSRWSEDGSSEYPHDDERNLQTLCRSCNRRKNRYADATQSRSTTGAEAEHSRAPARSQDLEKEVEETPKGVSSSTTTRSYETDAAAPSPNGRAAVETHEDINLEPRTAPRFDCPHCDQIFPTWGDRQIHVDLDHVTDKEHA